MNVFYIEPESRWDYLIENSKQNDIAIKIDKALAKVEQNNPTLKGALPNNYYAGLSLDRTKLATNSKTNKFLLILQKLARIGKNLKYYLYLCSKK